MFFSPVKGSVYKPYTSATLTTSSIVSPVQAVRHSHVSVAPRAHEWTEYQPVEKKYVDYVPETKIEYRPVERTYQDYVEIKHVTDYEPVKRVQKRTEYVPVDHYDEYVDYYPKQYSYYTRSPQEVEIRASQVQSSIVHPSIRGASSGVYRSGYNY